MTTSRILAVWLAMCSQCLAISRYDTGAPAPPDDPTNSSVGAVRSRNLGSGVVLADTNVPSFFGKRYLVATAAHNLEYLPTGQILMSSERDRNMFSFTLNDQSFGGLAIRHPNYPAGNSISDLAIFLLEDGLDVQGYPLATTEDVESLDGSILFWNGSEVKISGVISYGGQYSNTGSTSIYSIGTNMLTLKANPYHPTSGDSGGAVVAEFEGVDKLVGILQGADSPASRLSIAVRADTNREFLLGSSIVSFDATNPDWLAEGPVRYWPRSKATRDTIFNVNDPTVYQAKVGHGRIRRNFDFGTEIGRGGTWGWYPTEVDEFGGVTWSGGSEVRGMLNNEDLYLRGAELDIPSTLAEGNYQWYAFHGVNLQGEGSDSFGVCSEVGVTFTNNGAVFEHFRDCYEGLAEVISKELFGRSQGGALLDVGVITKVGDVGMYNGREGLFTIEAGAIVTSTMQNHGTLNLKTRDFSYLSDIWVLDGWRAPGYLLVKEDMQNSGRIFLDADSSLIVEGNLVLFHGSEISGSGNLDVQGDLIWRGALKPGGSTGELNLDGHAVLIDGSYEVEILDPYQEVSDGIRGWDVVNVSSMEFSYGGTPFHIRVSSLAQSADGTQMPGPLDRFNASEPFSVPIISAEQGITGFENMPVELDISLFANELQGGSFSVRLIEGREIVLRFNPAGTRVDGDFNSDGLLDAIDLGLLEDAVRQGTAAQDFDVDLDSLISRDDIAAWITDVLGSWMGDANLDGVFDSGDMVAVFQAGEYEDSITGNSRWTTGDWNGDHEFDTGDLILAFQGGGYGVGPRFRVVANVPEVLPSLAGLFCGFWIALRGSAATRKRFKV